MGLNSLAMLFKVYSSVSEESLSDFLTLLPDAKQYFADGAKIYQDCWVKNFIAKSKAIKRN